MRSLARALGAIFLVLAAAGIVCCVAAIKVWSLQQVVARIVERIDARVEVGVQRTSAVNQSVQHTLQTARDAVKRVNDRAADLGPDPGKNRAATAVLQNLLQQQVGPNINELGGRLATFSDAAAVVASVLESFQELPLGEAKLLNPDRLERATDQASQLSAALRKLQASVGESDKAITKDEVVAAVSDLSLVLRKCQATLDNWQSDLNSALEQLARLKTQILGWLTFAAVAVTAFCAWGLVSQISLAAHAWKWVRGA